MGHGGGGGPASVMPAFVNVAWVLLFPGYNLSVLSVLGIFRARRCTPEPEGVEGVWRSGVAQRLGSSQG